MRWWVIKKHSKAWKVKKFADDQAPTDGIVAYQLDLLIAPSKKIESLLEALRSIRSKRHFYKCSKIKRFFRGCDCNWRYADEVLREN